MPTTGGHVMLAQEFAGFVTENTDITSNTTTTNVEFATTSVTWTAFAGVRYKATYRGNSESSVAGDSIVVRLRWANSGSPGTGGIEIAKAQVYADVVNHTFANVNLIGTFNSQAAGLVTVTTTIIRGGGTGNVKQNGTVSPLYFLIEII